MLKENMNQEEKTDTDTGTQELTVEQRLENLAKNVFYSIEKMKDMGTALDNVYIQVATLIEVLAEKEEILNPQIWEEKLKEVTQNIRDTMEAMENEERNNTKDNVSDPDRANENSGSGKIIMPNSGIIIPGK